MYIPKHFAETDTATLHQLLQAHPLGTWVVQAEGELVVNHIPFLLDRTRGPYGTLVAHIARANPVWQCAAAASVVVFQGTQAYITPSWYAAKQAHGKVVPTWNYAVVHAHGTPQVIEDTEWLLAQVRQLTETHEASEAHPWSVDDAPADFLLNQTRGIVGIEIPIERLEGKWKISQNRSTADQQGVIAGLQAREQDEAAAMARMLEERQ